MDTQSEGEDWPDPHQSTHSFVDPGGPFRPVRRFALYGIVLCLVLIVLAGAAQQIALAIVIGSAISTLGTVWLACWVLDTILAYLKR